MKLRQEQLQEFIDQKQEAKPESVKWKIVNRGGVIIRINPEEEKLR